MVLTEFQNFQNFVIAMIPMSTMAVTLRLGFLNMLSSPSKVIEEILKFCQIGFPESRETVLLSLPYEEWFFLI
ncbi:MAG: hypothetical protein EAZ81_06430 [Verrucomicrobia bacterium]|nr:MAG: hypothetical protein EAZ81_06430 [Verrucomicrobiota bacterium]